MHFQVRLNYFFTADNSTYNAFFEKYLLVTIVVAVVVFESVVVTGVESREKIIQLFICHFQK